MKIISWNVNGIRAVYKKGFVEFIEREEPDILCVQETKAHKDQCEPMIVSPAGRTSYWSSAAKKGYSGTATFVTKEPKEVAHGIGIPEYDSEGRIVLTDHGDFSLYNIYFPNGGSSPERHEYKQKFLRDLNAHLKPLIKEGRSIIVVGDYNVAHADIDIYDSIKLADASGFKPEERKWFDSFLELGFIDTFRYFHPDEKDRYSWWSMYERGRLGNRGWRIDYACVTTNLEKRLRSSDILDRIEASDHSPVVLELS